MVATVLRRLSARLVTGEEEGQTLVEYGLLIALIAIVVFAALLVHGPIVSAIFTDMGDSLRSI